MPPLVSAIIPTYNRARDVRIAVGSVLSQTYPTAAIEVLVVDDGSTDGTAELLRREFGDRVRLLSKSNGGVSSARNFGLAAARGEYLALLDSDDEWLPAHLERQIEFFTLHPDFGMVVTDVARMDRHRQDFDIFRRRDFVPEDGHVLRWVLLNPALAPSAATLRRAVYEDVGGFDEGLATAEDLDFHLRVALDWKIGVIEEPLTRAMRGHDGLSALPQTSGDDLRVMERFVRRHADRIGRRGCDAALLRAYARSARGKLFDGDLPAACRHAVSGVARLRDGQGALILARLGVNLAKGLAVRGYRAARRRAAR